MMLPARMTSRTASGASSGGRATPFESAVAVLALRSDALASSPWVRGWASEAGPVGSGSDVSSAETVPASLRSPPAVVCPATGVTSFGRAVGSGAISADSSGSAAAGLAAATSRSGADSPQPATRAASSAMTTNGLTVRASARTRLTLRPLSP